MEAGQGRWRGRAAAATVLALLAGCAGRLDRALLADRNPAAHRADPEAEYCLHCPDVVEVALPGWTGELTVGPDGRLPADRGAGVRVDGQTPAEAARHVADRLGVDPAGVRVRVTGFNSQRVYVHGEVAGLQRAVPYRGPETVVDLLQRMGGITPGAAPGDIQVVRARIADGRPPEVFHVDLEAILRRGDQATNVRLEPFDQVYVGQSRRNCIACCLPPWLRSVLAGFRPEGPIPSARAEGPGTPDPSDGRP
jgi:protein involved in polysaccharide export with SLBB domain